MADDRRRPAQPDDLTEPVGAGAPLLPRGRTVPLPGRGELFVREAGRRRPDRPSLVLLHGWTATADLNWFPAYGPLRRLAHVVSFDLHGHGRGLRRPDRFRLTDCADDVAAVADALGLEAIVPVGYSMGGLVAQLLWRRHPQLVRGLVLCATSRNFRGNAGDHLYFGGLTGLAAAARLAPGPLREQAFARFLEARIGRSPLTPWAVAELARHDFRTVLEAGAAIGAFSSRDWVGGVDVPTAVVLTTADTKIPPHRQRKLAAAIPDAETFEVAADHHACPRQAELFLPALRRAVRSVLHRADGGARAPVPGQSLGLVPAESSRCSTPLSHSE